jgi:hypothetical protein
MSPHTRQLRGAGVGVFGSRRGLPAEVFTWAAFALDPVSGVVTWEGPRLRTRSEVSAGTTRFIRWQARITSSAGRAATRSTRVAVTTPSAAAPQLDYLGGGQGANTIYGGAGGDSLTGGPGSDALFGGAMADFFDDGPGVDTIYGGLGNDSVYLGKDRTPDTVHCGPGHDVVWAATRVNTVAADCEEVHVEQSPGVRGLPQPVRVRGVLVAFH